VKTTAPRDWIEEFARHEWNTYAYLTREDLEVTLREFAAELQRRAEEEEKTDHE
jgi:hypothetical protein